MTIDTILSLSPNEIAIGLTIVATPVFYFGAASLYYLQMATPKRFRSPNKNAFVRRFDTRTLKEALVFGIGPGVSVWAPYTIVNTMFYFLQ